MSIAAMRTHGLSSKMGAGLAACAVTGLLISGVSVAEARTVTGNTDGLSLESIDCAGAATLTIVKTPRGVYENKPLSALPEYLVSGFRFSVTRIEGVDITTREGQEKARELSVEEAKKLLSGDSVEIVTDARGRATATGLQEGLYLVHEEGPTKQVEGQWFSKDFLIVVPVGSASEESKEWQCDVVVISKDSPRETPPPPTTVTTTTTPPFPPATTPPFPPATTPRITPPPSTVTPPATVPPTQPVPPNENTPPSRLVNTGANVLGVVGVGAVLLLVGFWLTRRRNVQDDSN